MTEKYFLKNIKELSIIIIICLYAHFINQLSGNIGVLPIDSFGFYDTGYSILKGKLPIRDFWIFTGILVDYFEALFFLIFGNNWSAHIFHASFINILASLSFYYFLRKINLKLIYATFYALCFATLCYPVSGTPFAYLHAYVFSLISLLVFYFAIKKENNHYWFILPIICAFAFLSMQSPTGYIVLFIIFLSSYFFFKTKNLKNFISFATGTIFTITLIIIYLLLTGTRFDNFIYQYFLFPLTIGEGRILGEASAYLSLKDQLNFKRIFGDFKFIQIFLIPLIIITAYKVVKKENNKKLLNVIFISASILFIYNQLLTANQIYIFSLIPVLAAILHINMEKLQYSKFIICLIITTTLFATIKFHHRYNIERKFHDLENINKSVALDASLIHKSLTGLKWISYKYPDPSEEVKILKTAIKTIKEDNRKKMLITHYHFISSAIEEDLNILNRWYLWDNNTHPTRNHKYFNIYKSMVNKKIQKEKIEVVYLLGTNIKFKRFKESFGDIICFKNHKLVNKSFSNYEIVSCKGK